MRAWAGVESGSVTMRPETTPYGRLAIVADPAGTQLKLRTPAQ